MLNTSQDVFYIVLAFGILWISLGLFWVLWYVGGILREFFTIIREVREKVQKIDSVLDLFRRKVENSGYHLTILSEGIRQLIDLYKKRVSGRSRKSKNKDEE